MAKMLPGFAFTGSLGNVSAYTMRGSDKIILRTKGGASKKKIKTSPGFAKTRKLNSEFGGRSKAAAWIMKMIWPQKALADYNISGALNALIKPIQAMDEENELGQRNIYFTRSPRLLEGFSLNKKYPFDSIIRNPLSCTLSRDELSAEIDYPELLPGINFIVPGNYPLYSLIATLGIIPDMLYAPTGYHAKKGYDKIFMKTAETQWYPVLNGSPASMMKIKLDGVTPDQSFSLVLAIGIRLGTMSGSSEVRQLKHSGAARILAVR